MFVVDRVRGGDDDCPEETLTIAGTTGNLYTIIIDQKPRCNCPHGGKGDQTCKHIIFAMVRVLKAPQKLQYQLALLKSELREIFAKAPSIAPVDGETTDNNRKPISDEDQCPICFMEFENGYEDTVHCKAACGNNVHKECFDQWAASRNASSAPVTCPFCRSKWVVAEGDINKKVLSKKKPKTSEGYVNVGAELGLPQARGEFLKVCMMIRR
jgi:hypothetical protein